MHPSLYLRSVSGLHRNFIYFYSQGIKKFELINNASFAYTWKYMKHQSAIKCTFALIMYLSLSVSIEISLFSIRCVYRLISSKIGDNKNVQKYTCSYKLRLCFKLWNHLNSWGSILWFMCFLFICGDVITWDMRRFSVSERKITLS